VRRLEKGKQSAFSKEPSTRRMLEERSASRSRESVSRWCLQGEIMDDGGVVYRLGRRSKVRERASAREVGRGCLCSVGGKAVQWVRRGKEG
jgi:hypothetical protein